MNSRFRPVLIGIFFTTVTIAGAGSEPAQVREEPLEAPNKVTVKVRMQGPYDADAPLQIVCYFKHKESGDTTLGAAVELDKRMRGVISSLRNRGEFSGYELETFLLTPPNDSIEAKLLLLIGLGDEQSLSLATMERVGVVAVREAARLGASRIAFAPLLRDQGNSKLGTGDVAGAVVRGVLLGYDTEKRLAKEGFTKDFTLEEWVEEAGPKYFEDSVSGIKKSIEQTRTALSTRPAEPYASSR